MTTHEQLAATEALAARRAGSIAFGLDQVHGPAAVAWADTCADHGAAAAMYERLSALSDLPGADSRAQHWRTMCAPRGPQFHLERYPLNARSDSC